MAAAFPSQSDALDLAKMFRASESCSVCLDAVNDSGERSIAKLKCGHHFHLDCIGSAFNAKGAMQCPNCRHVEDGQWLYANGSRWNEDFSIEEISYEDDYEVYRAMPDLVAALEDFPSVQNWGHLEWCPYQPGSPQAGGSSYPQFQMSLGEIGSPGFPEVVVNVLYNYNESGSASSPPPVCPHLAGQGGRHPRQLQVPEDPHVRPPVSHGPMRPLDSLAMPNVGSIMGDGVGVFSTQNRDIWGRRTSGFSSIPGYSDGPAGVTSIMPDSTRFFPEVDLSWTPRNSTTSLPSLYGDSGTSGLSPHERHRSWSRPDSSWSRADNLSSRADPSWMRPDLERAPSSVPSHTPNTYGPVPAQYGYSGLSFDGTSQASQASNPCPRPQYIHGQVGSSHPQSQNSSIRSGPIGSSRRLRHTGFPVPLISGARAVSGHLSDDLARRFSQSWSEPPVPLGQEPPVPGLESHRPGYHSDQGFVWRREAPPITSTSGAPSAGNTEAQWSWMSAVDFRHGDFTGMADGHGAVSRPSRDESFDQHRVGQRMNYSPPLVREGTTEVGTLSPHNLRHQR